MADVKSRQEYAQYRSEAIATYKQVYLETHEENEAALKQQIERMKRSQNMLPDVESGIAEMVIDNDVSWERVQDRAFARDVSQKTLDELYGIVCESALEQAKQAGYDGMSTGMRRYITDQQFDEIYDRSMAD